MLPRERCSVSEARNARARPRLLDEVGVGAERRLQLRKFSKGMLQRVGIAQALINTPELVILDGRRLVLFAGAPRRAHADRRLRDAGSTVFFSSHVLSYAEALCSRVAILAKGRLVAAGRLTDMLALRARGWEMVVAGASEPLIASLGSRVRRSVRISEDATRWSWRSTRRPNSCSRI